MRNRFGNGTGGVCFGRLNATLFATPAKLHHATFGKATVGYAFENRRIDNGTRGRSEAEVFIQIAQLSEGLV